MVQSSYVKLPRKILLGFDSQELFIKELTLDASLEFYGHDPVDMLIEIVIISIEQQEPIEEVLDREIADYTLSEKELKTFLAELHLRLVATLKSVGCYDKTGKLLYRFVKPIDKGFLLERV